MVGDVENSFPSAGQVISEISIISRKSPTTN